MCPTVSVVRQPVLSRNFMPSVSTIFIAKDHSFMRTGFCGEGEGEGSGFWK